MQNTRRFASIDKDQQEAYDLKRKLQSQNYHISGVASLDRSLSAPRRTQSNEKHFRTSFQESFTQKLIDKQHWKDVSDIKQFMHKQNVNMKGNAENLKVLLEITKDIDKREDSLTADYDNVNLVNHIPFADKNHKKS